MTLVDDYRPGACNIGPAEINRRRWTGHLGAVATLVAGGVLVAFDAPGWMRMTLFAPAAVGAAGYIQAGTRFCADYGWRGVFNFGEAGIRRTTTVSDRAARAADRRKALAIAGGSGTAGLLVVLVALAL